jgi:hypothetical protein
MYQEAFEKLDLAETATILDEIGGKLQGVSFDPVETTIMAAELPFYANCRLLDISNHTAMPAARRFVIHGPKTLVALDFTNGPIYKLNEDCPLKLNEANIATYARFFFTYVRGKHGRFIVVENVDDVPWKEDPPPTARQAIGRMIKPIALKENPPAGSNVLEIRMVFKDSLFKSDVLIKNDGLVSLSNEELLLEDMPVADDIFGQ